MDKEYAKMATSMGRDTKKGRQDDLTDFPIERVRLNLSKYAVLLCVPCIVGYGWALQHHTVRFVVSSHVFCLLTFGACTAHGGTARPAVLYRLYESGQLYSEYISPAFRRERS